MRRLASAAVLGVLLWSPVATGAPAEPPASTTLLGGFLVAGDEAGQPSVISPETLIGPPAAAPARLEGAGALLRSADDPLDSRVWDRFPIYEPVEDPGAWAAALELATDADALTFAGAPVALLALLALRRRSWMMVRWSLRLSRPAELRGRRRARSGRPAPPARRPAPVR